MIDQILTNEYFLLALTFGIYQGAKMLQRRTGSILLNPILIAIGLMIAFLTACDIPYDTYHKSGQMIEFWLKPAVVALGVPLYLQLSQIKKQILPILASQMMGCIVGIISVVVQFVCGYYLGSETPAIIGSLAAIIAIIAYAKIFARKSKVQDKETFTLVESFKAWSVYLFILVFILVSGALCPPVNQFLKSHLVSEVHLPVLDSTFKFGWISNAGLMLFLGATIGGLIQGLSIKKLMVILARTTVNLRKTVVTICSLIALASVMNYCGMITAIASGLVAVTGDYYPLVAPMIGAIGTFVTGSDTSSNILFAKLQAHVANQLGMTGQGTFFGMQGSESNWLVAANTTGATGGKMISPQSIAIATAACDMQGKDGEILRSAIPYAVMYIVLGGLMVFFGC